MSKSRPFLFYFFLIIMPILFSDCVNDSVQPYNYKFQFITENYKPFNYTDSGKIIGLGPDLLEKICSNLNIPYEVTVMPWDEGYALLKNNQNTVLFSTSMNAERKDLFKWAGPIASVEWYFYAQGQSQISLSSLDDAKKINAIGVLKDYSIEQYLVKQGFNNLVYCKDNQEAIDKLLKGTIDLFPADEYTTEATLKLLGKTIYSLKEVLPIKTDLIYFAFNKNIPDNVVADFQRGIDGLKTNGFLESLYQKYFNSSDFPGLIQVYTEDYPPLTFLNKYGEISGYGSDIVKEIMKRNRIYDNIKISAWSNGYELALINPNFCLFTMDRTSLRENLFNWVGPIGTNTTYLYTKSGSGIKINSLADAMKLSSIGTVSSWFSDQYLRNQGFSNLVSDKDPVVMAGKLMTGKIDAFVCSEVTFPDILKVAGYLYSNVTPAYSLMSSDFYIAFSKNSSASIVNQWQVTFDAMKNDGTIAAIKKRWFP